MAELPGRVEPNAVAAIIVTHNRREEVKRCIDAVAHQDAPPGGIVVVDSGSSDGTCQVLRSEYGGRIVVVESAENIGPAGGFAWGIRRAMELGFLWFWLFNDDDWPLPTALREQLAALSTLPDGTGMLACARAPTNGTRGLPMGSLWRHRRRRSIWAVGESVPVRVDLVAFSGTLVSRVMVQEIGVPREDFFMMFEETEFCVRAKVNGWSVYCTPQVLVFYGALGSSGPAAEWRKYYQTRNHLLMVKEMDPGWGVFWWAVQTARLIVASLRYPGGVRKSRLRLQGARDGFLGISGKVVEPDRRDT